MTLRVFEPSEEGIFVSQPSEMVGDLNVNSKTF
jgi:hypothetical protein